MPPSSSSARALAPKVIASPVRVVLAKMSRLTRDLVRGLLEAEPGVAVVGEVDSGTYPLRQLIEEAEADVVVVGTDAPGLLAACRDSLADRARLRILAVDPDGRGAQLYGIRPYELPLDELSLESIRELLGKHPGTERVEFETGKATRARLFITPSSKPSTIEASIPAENERNYQ